MGKRVQSTSKQGSKLVVRGSSCCKQVPSPHPSSPQHSKPKFLQFLTQQYRQTTNSQSQSQHFRAIPTPSAADFINFFNYQKYYSKIELHCYVICLANMITIGNTHQPIIATPEFKGKIRRFLQELSDEQTDTSSYSNKVQAVFYILAVLIYQERSVKKNEGKKNFRSIIADKGIMKAFLDIHLPSNAKISKFYGIIMVAITAKSHKRLIRESIVKNILLNIAKVEHESTLFNLLVYLRSEKNKISINLSDLKNGKVVKMLIKGYQQHIEQYQSFYMLDYLNHLIVLFPSLIEEAVERQFAVLLIRHLRLRNMHHPMHQTTILGFISRGLKHLEERSRNAIISDIYSLQPAQIFTLSKISKLLIEHCSSILLLGRVSEQSYLINFIEIITPTLEKNVLLNCVELLSMAIQKIRQVNSHVSGYLLWLLKNRLTSIGDLSLMRMLPTP